MTALLFIPPPSGAAPARRVDLASLARLFAEVEADAPAPRERNRAARIAMMVLILLGTIGDTVLVARNETVAGCLAAGAASKPRTARF